MATHTGERSHICPDCQKLFIEPGDVRKHMRTHSKDEMNFHTGGLPSLGRQGGREDWEAGGAKPLILYKGHKNDRPFRKFQRKVDTSEKGPDSRGQGRKHSRRSPSRRSELPERRRSNSGKFDKHTSTPKTIEHPNGEASTQVILQPESPLASPQSGGSRKSRGKRG